MVSFYSNLLNFLIILYSLSGSIDACGTNFIDAVYLPTNTTILEEPSIVSIEIERQHMCSGAIVSTQHIVTAAHCVCYLKNNFVNNVKIIIGISGSKERGTELSVKKIDCHPSITGKSLIQDNYMNIAIVETKEGILFGPKHRIATLPFFHKPVTSTENCYLLGWNLANKTLINSNQQLQALPLTVYAQNNCNFVLRRFYSEKFADEHLICASKEEYDITHLQDTRGRLKAYEWKDYGAPYYCDGMLLGITNVNFDANRYSRSDTALYTITKIQPLYDYFKSIIAEYTAVDM